MRSQPTALKLLPCPFCGHVESKVHKHFKEDMWRFLHRCPVMGPIEIDWKSSVEEIVKMWNTRK